MLLPRFPQSNIWKAILRPVLHLFLPQGVITFQEGLLSVDCCISSMQNRNTTSQKLCNLC